MKLLNIVAALLTLSTLSAAQASTVKPVAVKKVAVTEAGRAVVTAEGGTYIELTPEEFNGMTAQMIYEKHREKFRAGFAEEQEKADQDFYRIDRSKQAGIYTNTGSLPPRETTAGISIPDLKVVRGLRYQPTREERLTNPSARTYIVVKDDDKKFGAYAAANCGQVRPQRDVLNNYLSGNGTCASLRVFKKF